MTATGVMAEVKRNLPSKAKVWKEGTINVGELGLGKAQWEQNLTNDLVGPTGNEHHGVSFKS